jgi:hypothetical protein
MKSCREFCAHYGRKHSHKQNFLDSRHTGDSFTRVNSVPGWAAIKINSRWLWPSCPELLRET